LTSSKCRIGGEGGLVDRVVQDSDMELPAFFNPNLRNARWLDRLQPGQNIMSLGDCLDIEPVPRFGQAEGDALFVVCHDCHGGNLPLVRPDFKCFLSVA